MFCSKTNDCTGWCIYEDDVNIFKCPVCRKNNCITCAAIHEGIDCLTYQRKLAIDAETDENAKSSRLMLEVMQKEINNYQSQRYVYKNAYIFSTRNGVFYQKMITRGEALECPACHVVLLKKWGCDWVKCSYCKTEICWVTKKCRWGPNGKGDVTGGNDYFVFYFTF